VSIAASSISLLSSINNIFTPLNSHKDKMNSPDE
jgi:hypothetical protein